MWVRKARPLRILDTHPHHKEKNTLVDKLGKNDIIWEKDGFTNKSKVWITYEEVNNANAHKGPIQNEEGSRDRVGSPAA